MSTGGSSVLANTQIITMNNKDILRRNICFKPARLSNHIQIATGEENNIENRQDIEQQEDVQTEERKTERLAR